MRFILRGWLIFRSSYARTSRNRDGYLFPSLPLSFSSLTSPRSLCLFSCSSSISPLSFVFPLCLLVGYNLTAFYSARVFIRHYIETSLLFTVRVHPTDIFYGLNFMYVALLSLSILHREQSPFPTGFQLSAASSDVPCRLHAVIFFSPSSTYRARCIVYI